MARRARCLRRGAGAQADARARGPRGERCAERLRCRVGGEAARAVREPQRTPRACDRSCRIRVRALSALGRAAEAEALITANSARLDSLARVRLVRMAAWGWVRAGDLAKARAAMGTTPMGEDEDRTMGWISLYEGDLKIGASHPETNERDGPRPAARARASRAHEGGQRAGRRERVSGARARRQRGGRRRSSRRRRRRCRTPARSCSMPPRASSRRGTTTARPIALWQRIVSDVRVGAGGGGSRARSGRGRFVGTATPAAAVQRLEHMILTYPRSALVPQARRELDLARQSVPST